MCRALTRHTLNPRASSTSNTGIQYTPVLSIATVSTPHATSQSASACKSGVKVLNLRTRSGVRSAGTHAQISRVPISSPAAFGCTHARLSKETLCLLILASSQSEITCQPIPSEGRRILNGVGRAATSVEITREQGPACSAGAKAPVRSSVLLLAGAGTIIPEGRRNPGGDPSVSLVRNAREGMGACSRRAARSLRSRWRALGPAGLGAADA